MQGRTWKTGVKIALCFLSFGIGITMGWAADAPRITKEELKSMLDYPDIIIIDVRTKSDWVRSKQKIRGAVREDPKKDVKSWAGNYAKDKTLVFYCA